MTDSFNDPQHIYIKDSTANPAPLGLLAFGLTTLLLNLHNVGLFPLDATIVGLGIFYGGMAQVFAGSMEYRKANTFGTVAFTSYGLFWISLAALIILDSTGVIAKDAYSYASYLGLWGFVTLLLFFCTLRMNLVMQAVFGLLALLFFMLSIGFFLNNSDIIFVAGLIGLLTGLTAIYAGYAQIVNEVFGEVKLPLDR